MPERIQLKRTKGWRKPEGAVVVARPSRWGNPFRVVADDSGERVGWWVYRNTAPGYGFADTLDGARQIAVDAFAEWFWEFPYPGSPGAPPDLDDVREQLAGKDLACWCPLDAPCHADVLLEIANAPVGVQA